MIITIIAFILILGLLVFVHEFGHLIAAKKNGVKVHEFGIGFPPRLFSKKYKNTVYSINLIPLGGFIKEDEKSFYKASLFSRFKILSAGVGMNIALCVLCLTIISVFVYPWYQGIFMGIAKTGELMVLIFIVLGKIITTGKFAGEVLGPIGIASVTGEFVQAGALQTIYFIALLSVNLAIINILPFPALDGGKLLFLGLEKIKGKKINQKTEKIVHGIGFAILIAIMLVITYRDIIRFF